MSDFHVFAGIMKTMEDSMKNAYMNNIEVQTSNVKMYYVYTFLIFLAIIAVYLVVKKIKNLQNEIDELKKQQEPTPIAQSNRQNVYDYERNMYDYERNAYNYERNM